jgi:uncharacterized protein YjiS (DUF1127 family)
MALSLFGERSVVAATPVRPFALLAKWIADARMAQTRRTALRALLELEPSRLDDLGISRQDIADALEYAPRQAGLRLHAARASTSRR